MQQTFTKLNLLGYKVDRYLVGLNQFISKEIIVVKHISLPTMNIDERFAEENGVLLPSGQVLFTNTPHFWYKSFTSDEVIVDGLKQRQWRADDYSIALQEWVTANGNKKAPYDEYRAYTLQMDDTTFAEFVDKLYDKVASYMEDEKRYSQFMSLMINTGYVDSDLMAEIASSYTLAQVEKFIEAVEQCKKLSLPVTDYREVFNFSQTN